MDYVTLRPKQAIGNLLKEALIKLIPFMVRRPKEVPVVQAHHECNQLAPHLRGPQNSPGYSRKACHEWGGLIAVRPEPIGGLLHKSFKILYWLAFTLIGTTFPIVTYSETLVLEPVVITADKIGGYATETATSATRDDTALLETPYSISVIDNAALKDSYTLRLEDAAQFAAGVEQGSGQGGFDTDLIIRGFSIGGRVYLDGLLDNQRFQVREWHWWSA